jgi:hypothetical protein
MSNDLFKLNITEILDRVAEHIGVKRIKTESKTTNQGKVADALGVHPRNLITWEKTRDNRKPSRNPAAWPDFLLSKKISSY